MTILPDKTWRASTKTTTVVVNAVLAGVVQFFVSTTVMALSDFPRAPASDLRKDFPACITVAATLLVDLRRCNTDLEIFRETVLERHNKKIQRYIKELKEFDSELEALRSSGAIPDAPYQMNHGLCAKELERAGKDGDLMEPYHDYLARYVRTAQWATVSIIIEERKVLQNVAQK